MGELRSFLSGKPPIQPQANPNTAREKMGRGVEQGATPLRNFRLNKTRIQESGC